MFPKPTGILDFGTGEPRRNYFVILNKIPRMLYKVDSRTGVVSDSFTHSYRGVPYGTAIAAICAHLSYAGGVDLGRWDVIIGVGIWPAPWGCR